VEDLTIERRPAATEQILNEARGIGVRPGAGNARAHRVHGGVRAGHVHYAGVDRRSERAVGGEHEHGDDDGGSRERFHDVVLAFVAALPRPRRS
jgi:hypothetical protein